MVGSLPLPYFTQVSKFVLKPHSTSLDRSNKPQHRHLTPVVGCKITRVSLFPLNQESPVGGERERKGCLRLFVQITDKRIRFWYCSYHSLRKPRLCFANSYWQQEAISDLLIHFTAKLIVVRFLKMCLSQRFHLFVNQQGNSYATPDLWLFQFSCSN